MSDGTQNRPGDTVSFGFKTVPEAERQGLINDIFSAVADATT